MRCKNIDDYKFYEIKRTKYMIKQTLFTLDWHSMYKNNFTENLQSSILKNSYQSSIIQIDMNVMKNVINTFLKAVQFNQYFVSLYNCFIVKLMRCFLKRI